MQQSVALVTAGCNKQNVAFNNQLLKLQPAVILQFCNITAGCYLNHWLLHTIFCLLSACWIKTNGMIYIPIMFCPLTVEGEDKEILLHDRGGIKSYSIRYTPETAPSWKIAL